jgi:N-acetylmuramoyl-L-alanine amidase
MQTSTEISSPNWNERPNGAAIDTVVLHYTGMKTGVAALARLCDPAAEVSSHYLIEEDGQLFQLVAEEKRAWHAGVSCWQGRENLNDTSIGIELVNPGHEFGYRSFPQKQIESLLVLLDSVKSRHKIGTARFLGHSDIAPGRKMDPGNLFPWKVLAKNGFGIFSDKSASDQTIVVNSLRGISMDNKLNKQLGIVGYHGCNRDSVGGGTGRALTAFQAHWRPEAVTGKFDKGTALVLDDIANMILVGDLE